MNTLKCNFLIDCHCFDSNMSQGITTYIKGIYSLLPSKAPNINFFFMAQDIERLKNIFGEDKNIKYIKLKSHNKLYRLVYEIPQLIKRHKIDMAHFQYISPLIKNCKTIVTLHDILFVDFPQFFPLSYRLLKGLLFKVSAKRCDLLCTVSNYSKERISKCYNISNNKIIITPNAVSKDFKDTPNKKLKSMPQKYILYVSRIEPRKNHIAAVNIFNKLDLANKGYKLVLIGKETVSTPQLHALINNLSETTKSNILVIPQVSYDDLKLWYKNASLFIYPSIAEGFGIPPIEAAVSGIPVICNNSTAMSDFFFFKENLVDFNDEKTVLNRIQSLLNEDTKNQNLSEIVLNCYSWDTIANNFLTNLTKQFSI